MNHLDWPNIKESKVGEEMHSLMRRLWPICRSITGNGFRETLNIIKEHVPLELHEIPSGIKVFDWTVPKEWNIRDAYIKNSRGEKIVDFQKSNLHVVNYSIPVHKKIPLSELRDHLHTLPDRPDAIPYITSYYNPAWGFCMTQRQYDRLKDDTYEVVIDSTLENGHLTYGELFLKGELDDEVLISTYSCHPSMANDSLSGTVITAFLAKALVGFPLRHSYRFLFLPETIGAITWLAKHQSEVSKIKHGLVIYCAGDRGSPTYKKSRQGNAVIDKAFEKVLTDSGTFHEVVEFYPLGSDERQYCSPGFNLPVGAFLRSRPILFPEYHTSDDNLDVTPPESLKDSLDKCMETLFVLENNQVYANTITRCEPQLGKRGLYKTKGGPGARPETEVAMRWVLNYSDGSTPLLDIAARSKLTFRAIKEAADSLVGAGLLKDISQSI